MPFYFEMVIDDRWTSVKGTGYSSGKNNCILISFYFMGLILSLVLRVGQFIPLFYLLAVRFSFVFHDSIAGEIFSKCLTIVFAQCFKQSGYYFWLSLS